MLKKSRFFYLLVFSLITGVSLSSLLLVLFHVGFDQLPHMKHETLLIVVSISLLISFVVTYLLLLKSLRNTNDEYQLLDSIMNSASDIIFYKDLKGRFLGGNNAFCKVYNIDPEKINEITDKELYSSELYDYIRGQDNEVINSGHTLRYENWIPTKDGKSYLREILKSPLYDAKGTIRGVVGIGRDISEQHRIKLALHQRERLLGVLTRATQHVLESESSFDKSLQEALGMIGRECNADSVMIYEEVEVNRYNDSQFKLQHSWWRNSNYADQMQRIFLRQELVDIRRKIEDDRIASFKKTVKSPEVVLEFLKTMNASSLIVAAISYEGDFWGLLCVSNFNKTRSWSPAERAVLEIAAAQISVLLQRQQTEESLYKTFDALRKSQSRLSIALKAANALPFEFDLVTGKVEMDNAFFTSLGYESDWSTATISDTLFLVHPDDQKLIRDEIENVLSGESDAIEVTVRFKRKNGAFSWFNFMGTSRYEGNQAAFVTGLAQDITDRKNAENELLQSERMAAVGTLASGIAHNFNNLNTGIIGHLEMLRRKETLTPRGLKKLDLIISTVKRSITLTDSLLAFSGKRKGRKELHQLAPLIEDTVSLITSEFEQSSIEFRVYLKDATVWCSAGEVCHVIFNLLANARHAMIDSPKKIITINCWQEGENSYFSIADTGCGIKADKLKDVFMPFYTTKGEHAKVGSSLAAIRGTGLGLSSSKSIIENHHGEISVESVVDQGTKFTIRIPAGKQGEDY